MNNISIVLTGNDSALIEFSSRDNNGTLIAGCDSKHKIAIHDGQFLRRITGEFFKLKNMNYTGTVAVKIGDSPRMKFDHSLWSDLADALVAFTWHIDLSKHLGDLVAA